MPPSTEVITPMPMLSLSLSLFLSLSLSLSLVPYDSPSIPTEWNHQEPKYSTYFSVVIMLLIFKNNFLSTFMTYRINWTGHLNLLDLSRYSRLVAYLLIHVYKYFWTYFLIITMILSMALWCFMALESYMVKFALVLPFTCSLVCLVTFDNSMVPRWLSMFINIHWL